jgi:lipoprotein-releasing system permease protein
MFCRSRFSTRIIEYKPIRFPELKSNTKTGADETAITEQLQTIFNNKITVKNRAQLNESLYKNVEYGEYWYI